LLVFIDRLLHTQSLLAWLRLRLTVYVDQFRLCDM
jgi:hypothetical protein